jgi:hypothetical protein
MGKKLMLVTNVESYTDQIITLSGKKIRIR